MTRPVRATGAVSAHGLPRSDPSVDALSDALRQTIAQHWTRRVTSELQVSYSFEALLPRLRVLDADATVLAMVARSATEEQRHAELCLHLANVYAGRRVDVPPVPFALPSFGFDDEHLEVALHIAGLCCINETMATAYLEHSLALATAPIAVAAHRAHLREEVDHARLGWAHLASPAVSDETRAALARCVPRLLDANVPLWERPDAFLPSAGVPDHGLPSHADCVRVARAAVNELVLPGFRHVRVPVGAWRNALPGRD